MTFNPYLGKKLVLPLPGVTCNFENPNTIVYTLNGHNKKKNRPFKKLADSTCKCNTLKVE